MIFFLRGYFKTIKLAQYGVINHIELLICSRVKYAFLRFMPCLFFNLGGFKTASNLTLSLHKKRPEKPGNTLYIVYSSTCINLT